MDPPNEVEVVDWRFRRLEEGEKGVGGWRGSIFMLGAACCGYLGFGGLFFNLVLYLMRVLQESPANSANDITNLLGTMFFTALIGAFLGDAYIGRLWTVILFLIIYVIGCVLVGVAVTLQEQGDPTKPVPGSLKAFLFAGLYITAIGNGSYEPGLASLGGDQFKTTAEKTTFFNWFFVFCNIGQLIALTLITWFENDGHWAVGFWVSGGVVLASLPIFLLGAPKCRQYRPSGNPLLRIAQVFVCFIRKATIRVSPDAKQQMLYEVPYGTPSTIHGSRPLLHSPQLSWLDRAAIATTLHDKANPWMVCTVNQVEEVKCLIKIFPFLIAGVLFNTILAQITTLFIEQGATMDGHIGRHFSIPPGSMQVFTVFAAIIFAPLYDYFLVPLLRKKTGHEKGLTTLQRMGWGFVVSIIAMVVAAIVERKRLSAARSSPLIDVPYATMPISIYWLVPQYVILGIALVFSIVGQMDFFYTELSDGMRSIGISLPLVCRGLGNYASTLLVTIVTHVTSRGGKLGWIPVNLNRGHIDYFYWVLAILMTITLIFYVIAAYFYTYLKYNSQNHHNEEIGLTNKHFQ